MSGSQIYDAVIVGGGPAGLSAAQTLGRSCRRVLLVDDGRPRNGVAKEMHGLLSRDGTPPHELLRLSRMELGRYAGVCILDGHVDSAVRESGRFRIGAGDKWYVGRRLLLATGLYDALPEIAGLRELWGKRAFICPYCDGWEVRGKRLAVVGKGRKAIELAQELRQWSDDLLICTQAINDLTEDDARWLKNVAAAVNERLIENFALCEGRVSLTFEDGSRDSCDAAFLRAPLRQRYPLVDMLGCDVRSDGQIHVDDRGRTSVPGCYAAGDAVTAIHQVALAAASGVAAAIGINEDLLAEEIAMQIRLEG